MGGNKSVSDLKVNPRNPRKITDKRLSQLEKSMREFGDISGILFNQRTGNLGGGNQRSRNLDETAKVVITKKYAKPTKTGTVAIGYILHEGEMFAYREVDWDVDRETAAMIAANKNAGNWDEGSLHQQMRHLASFDVDFDLELTMFDELELKRFQPVEEFIAEEHWTEKFEPPEGHFKFIVTITDEKRKNEFLNKAGITTIKKKTGKVWSVTWPEE